jgi:ribosomal protein L21E
MMFVNPEFMGLLNGRVDIYINATFDPCTPHPFYQCLIIMVLNPSTGSYVSVIYTLMTHTCTVYWQVFNQVKVLTKNKMEICTYTRHFKRAEMNTLEVHVEDPDKKHVGCFFHLKQAWFKHLKEKLGMGLSSSLGLVLWQQVAWIFFVSYPKMELLLMVFPFFDGL